MNTSAANATHTSVMLQEVLDAILSDDNIENPWFLDGTLGLAGHSKALLEKSGKNAQLCGLDRDPQALSRAKDILHDFKDNCHFFATDFASFEDILPEINFPKFNGVLLDLGVSSLQLDVAERGFSYHHDGPLNMRMDMGTLTEKNAAPHSENAKSFVNKADFNSLRQVISEFGEDPQAARIARHIIDARQKKDIESTKELADIVYYAYPPKWRTGARNHPATRTFQAIRMYVNNELGQLKFFLDRILPHVADNGIIAIISFHSLEDRVVKQTFKEWTVTCTCPPHIPRCVCNSTKKIDLLTKKPLLPSQAECSQNPRASSAKLRIARKKPQTI